MATLTKAYWYQSILLTPLGKPTSKNKSNLANGGGTFRSFSGKGPVALELLCRNDKNPNINTKGSSNHLNTMAKSTGRPVIVITSPDENPCPAPQVHVRQRNLLGVPGAIPPVPTIVIHEAEPMQQHAYAPQESMAIVGARDSELLQIPTVDVDLQV